MNQGNQGPQVKRKSTSSADNDSGGYNSDDDDDEGGMKGGSQATSSTRSRDSDTEKKGPRSKKKRKLDREKREERNAREKERSFRISKQINELRDLLSSGGVIVPKGTKSSVLSEAANYIRTLQQHHYRSEIDRHQLIQQMQLIGGGAHGPQAAAAIRHVAAQNGVWSLGNFGGVPPKSAMSFYQAPAESSDQQATVQGLQPTKVEPSDYRYIFSNCGVGIAIASMGGAFLDCNQLFSQLSNYTKQELCSLTIFNLTARQDLQHAFDLISQMISPPMDSREDSPKPIVLRGSMKNRNDLGLCITLVKGEDGIAKCFCVTLIKNPASPFDTNTPVPVSFDAVQPLVDLPSGMTKDQIESIPTFTSG
jgi:PAS domain-containing protein